MEIDKSKEVIKLNEDEHRLVPGSRTWPISEALILYDSIARIREGFLTYDISAIPFGAEHRAALERQHQALEVAGIALGQLEELIFGTSD